MNYRLWPLSVPLGRRANTPVTPLPPGPVLIAEHGHSHGHSHGPVALPEDDEEPSPRGRRERADSISSLYQHPAQTRAQVIETAHEFGYGRDGDSGFAGAMSPPSHHRAGSLSKRAQGSISLARPRGHRHGSGNIAATTEASSGLSTTTTAFAEISPKLKADDAQENGVKPKHAKDANAAEQGGNASVPNDLDLEVRDDEDDDSHNGGDAHGHSHGGHGHSHGSMNMQGVFLHVLGDA